MEYGIVIGLGKEVPPDERDLLLRSLRLATQSPPVRRKDSSGPILSGTFVP